LGREFKSITDAMKAGKTMEPAFLDSARIVADTAQQQPHRFPAGSGMEAGVETAAKAEIWERPEEFAERHDKFIESSGALLAAAEAGNAEDFATHFSATGEACKNCHQTFRARKD
jgi:cytochrome c556